MDSSDLFQNTPSKQQNPHLHQRLGRMLWGRCFVLNFWSWWDFPSCTLFRFPFREWLKLKGGCHSHSMIGVNVKRPSLAEDCVLKRLRIWGMENVEEVMHQIMTLVEHGKTPPGTPKNVNLCQRWSGNLPVTAVPHVATLSNIRSD